MIRSKYLAGTILSLACALSAQPTLAQGMDMHSPSMAMHSHGMGAMHMGGSPFLMLLKSANLTPAQQSQVRLILNSNRAQMQSLHRQLMTLHEQIAGKLLTPGQVTSADLKPLIQKASSLEADLNQNMAETAVAIRNVLTADQVKRLAEVHQKLHSLHTQIQSLMGPAQDMSEPDDN